MTRNDCAAWLNAFCESWHTLDSEAFADLFTDHAAFFETPFETPDVGREALVKGWDGLKALQQGNRMDCEILAVVDDTCVARWRASYTNRQTGAFRELDGIFLLRFATDGRCCELIEWRHARDDGVPVPT